MKGLLDLWNEEYEGENLLIHGAKDKMERIDLSHEGEEGEKRCRPLIIVQELGKTCTSSTLLSDSVGTTGT